MNEVNARRYDTRCYFNVRSKADISQLNLPSALLRRQLSHDNFVGRFVAVKAVLRDFGALFLQFSQL